MIKPLPRCGLRPRGPGKAVRLSCSWGLDLSPPGKHYIIKRNVCKLEDREHAQSHCRRPSSEQPGPRSRGLAWAPGPPMHPKQRQAFCLLTHAIPRQPRSVRQSPLLLPTRPLPRLLLQHVPWGPLCPRQTALCGRVPRVSLPTHAPAGQDNGPCAPWDPKSNFREGGEGSGGH